MTITLTREEAQQLLEVFELFLEEAEDVTTLENNLVKMLRTRLAQPEPEPEHVATIGNWGKVMWREGVYPQFNNKLYTAPPQREWQGLTDEEVGMLTVFDGLHHVEVPLLAEFIRAIEAKLKEKSR
jgi:hypothetical protein